MGTNKRNVRICFCMHTSTHTLYSHVPDVIVRKAPVGSGDHSEVPPGVKRLIHLIMPILLMHTFECVPDYAYVCLPMYFHTIYTYAVYM